MNEIARALELYDKKASERSEFVIGDGQGGVGCIEGWQLAHR